MYQASTVLTGSEMPAVAAIGSCAVAGCHPRTTSVSTATPTRAARRRSLVCIVVLLPFLSGRRYPPTQRESSELPQQAAKSVDAVVDSAAPQRIPDDRLMRRHDIDAELALERVDRIRGRPMRRGQQDRIGVRVLAHQLAPHLERGVARNPPDLVECAAPTGRAEHLAAEMGAGPGAP